MEAALDVLARRVGIDRDRDVREAPEWARFPFDPRRRRMSIVAGDRVIVKGAPDAVLALCSNPGGAGHALHSLASRGLRVLGVATRSIGGEGHPAPPRTLNRP
jgi:magnesium-transporting ATPase (P-type)